MIAFELDPNLVRPGWTALIVVIVLALIMVGLFISMMRQIRKIKVPPSTDDQPADDHSADDAPGDDQPEDSTEESSQEKPRQHNGAG